MPQQDGRDWHPDAAPGQPRKLRLARPELFWKVLAGLILCLATAGSRAQDDPRQLLLRVRERVMDTERHLPRFACTETVDRTRYEPFSASAGVRPTRSCDDTLARSRRDGRGQVPSSADRLRLDVAVNFDGPRMENEMYSWAGENRFSDRDLFELVHDGAMSTGSFASLLASIFGNDAARFSYAGDTSAKAGSLAEFTFQVARERSQYLYVYGDHLQNQLRVAFDGSIFADPGSSDLVRLRVRTEQLPAETGICELTRDVDYGRVRLNGSEFLLPTEVRIVAIHTDGTVAENRVHYSGCREFRGDSTVRFETPGESEETLPPRNAPAARLRLPPGIAFKVVFTGRIDPTQAAAGDPIQGKLKTAIRDASDKVLVAEGTVVTGRIMSIRRFYKQRWLASKERSRAAAGPSLSVAIRLETIDLGGVPHPLNAAFDSGTRRFVQQTGPFAVRVDIGSLDDLHNPAEVSDTGIFEFWENDPDQIVKSSLESNWITAQR
jgi:hypothetical protein